MKIPIILITLLVIAAVSCKKKPTVYVSMTTYVNGDSAWTTDEVTTQNAGGTVYVNATKSALNSEVTLALYNYHPGNHTYIIQNTGIGANIHASGAQYQSGSSGNTAESGQINVTGTTTKTIQGSFDFSGGGYHVTGIFIAPLP